MAQMTTYYFATTPEDRIRGVAQKLSGAVADAAKDGYSIVSVQPHIGIVDGVSCTIGYTLLASKSDGRENSAMDDLPIVVSVS